MRRLYESSAVRRDENDNFTPSDHKDRDIEPQAMRRVPGNRLSRLLVPNSLRYRAISVSIETVRETYPENAAIPFVVEMKNHLPIPVEVPTLSPLLWTWSVDGKQDAASIDIRDPPAETRGFRFDRGERKRFRKRWNQQFRVSESEWERARRGEHVISAALNVEDPAQKGLYSETTIQIE